VESSNVANFDHVSVVALGRELLEIYIRIVQYKMELRCQINILLWNNKDGEPLWS